MLREIGWIVNRGINLVIWLYQPNQLVICNLWLKALAGFDSQRKITNHELPITNFPRSFMIKSDRWIRRMAQEHDMINPYSEKQVSEGVISYGVSSYGYDLRVADEFKIFTNVNSTIVDPKHFDERSFVTVNADVALVPPNSFALARSVEYFKIPRDVLTICVGKSTYARCGIIVNVTPFEPEWEGFVTLEISNTTPLPAKIYANEGLCQILFFQSDEVCETSYKDRKGKYQSQKGIVLPKL
jgi:dCTP deaminase